ncbi:MAG TPA: UDP-galactose-lipid carrier transferase [Savagea sp.]
MTNYLHEVDLSKTLKKKEYKRLLKHYQFELLKLQQAFYMNKIPAVFAFEGWDAAGKGGAIKRVTERLDPRGYRVHPTAAPNIEEKQEHYLQRFWRNMPRAGGIAMFDRSWYGRVLVERVEQFATEDEWQRAYGQINDFEKMLYEEGAVVGKFWFHISKDEQLARFKSREEDPFRRWKLTDEDWRNREKWDDYEDAVNDMFEKTHKKRAPWYIIEGNNKRYARVRTLQVMTKLMKKELQRRGIDY